MIVATGLEAAYSLLADNSLRREGTRRAVLEIGLHCRRQRRRLAFAFTDLEGGSWD